MTSPRDEALTLLRRAREELEGVSAFITGVQRPGTAGRILIDGVANEQLDVWARVQQATNVVEKLMSELSTLASYEFAVAADSRKVSVRLANDRRRAALAADRSVRAAGRGYVGPSNRVTLHTPEESA